MRIALMSSHDDIIGFLDNEVPECSHFYAASLHTYLTGNAYTLALSVATEEQIAPHLKEGCKLSFREAGTDYYLTIVGVERDEDEISVEAWGLSLELTNEEVGPSDLQDNVSIEEYLKYLGFEQDVLYVDTSRLSGEKRRLKFDSKDSILHRIYELAAAFDAEAAFEVKLKKNYALDRINLVFYPSGARQGVGRDRTDQIIRYGSGVTGIKKAVDISNLYTCIRPTGKTEAIRTKTEKTEWTYPDGSKRTVTVITVTSDSKREIRTKEEISVPDRGVWAEMRIDVTFKENNGQETVMPQAVYTSPGSKPVLTGSPRQTVFPATLNPPNDEDPAIETALTLDGFGVSAADKNGSYFIEGGDLRAPDARNRFPASLRTIAQTGALADGYIVKYFDSNDCEDQGTLFAKAVKELQTGCMPKVKYSLSGYVPGQVGDWVMVEDSQFDPPIYLQCRIIEQVLDLCYPSESKTVFDNFTTIESQINEEIMAKSRQLIEQSAVYDVIISSSDGTVFQDNETSHLFTVIVRQNGLDVTESLKVIWTLDGIDLAEGDPRLDGKSIRLSPQDLGTTAVLSVRAVSGSTFRGSEEITLQKSQSPTISQQQNPDGSLTIITESAGISASSILRKGEDGFSPSVDLSKSGKISTLIITDKDGAQTTQIHDGADGLSPTALVSKSGDTATILITDQNGTTTTTVSDGKAGDPGTGIRGISKMYTKSSGYINAPAEGYGWSTIPAKLTADAPYMWEKTSYSMTDGSTKVINSVCAVRGADGKDGEPGAAGNGIASVVVKHYQSYSSTAPAQTSTSWSTSLPTSPVAGYYLHTQIAITMTDGTTKYFYLKTRNGSNGTSPTVVNSLTSTSTSSALSAYQGKVLADRVSTLESSGGGGSAAGIVINMQTGDYQNRAVAQAVVAGLKNGITPLVYIGTTYAPVVATRVTNACGIYTLTLYYYDVTCGYPNLTSFTMEAPVTC